MTHVEVASFADIADEFRERVGKMVWCNLATVDAKGRPRSRVVHPIWEESTGWLGVRPDTPKLKHLAHNPAVSLAYVADVAKPAYAECVAGVVDDLEIKERIWNLCLRTPPPLGFDPAPMFGAFDSPGYVLLRFVPWRIWLADPLGTGKVWLNRGQAR